MGRGSGATSRSSYRRMIRGVGAECVHNGLGCSILFFSHAFQREVYEIRGDELTNGGEPTNKEFAGGKEVLQDIVRPPCFAFLYSRVAGIYVKPFNRWYGGDEQPT